VNIWLSFLISILAKETETDLRHLMARFLSLLAWVTDLNIVEAQDGSFSLHVHAAMAEPEVDVTQPVVQ